MGTTDPGECVLMRGASTEIIYTHGTNMEHTHSVNLIPKMK